jgi:hypothetical protein
MEIAAFTRHCFPVESSSYYAAPSPFYKSLAATAFRSPEALR